MQRQPSGEMRPVAYASKSMTNTECRYAQIEKKILATTWALEHWSDLLVGMKFTVKTDHKPVVPLFTTKLIDELLIRIQRFRMRLMRYNFDNKHVPGKELHTADALSRCKPNNEEAEQSNKDDLYLETDCYVNSILVQLPASDKRLEDIRSELKTDDTLKLVMHYVQHGWPENKNKLYGPVKKCWNEQGNLSAHEDLLMRGKRLVIPLKLRPDILRYLHDGHQGVTKTRENAASSVWWPGISSEIESMVRNCATCEKYRRERVEPLKGTEFPDRPWSKIAADFFQHEGKCYLLVVDYYSRDIEIYKVPKNVTSTDTILKMKDAFSRHGIPDVLISDNGPQFDSAEFRRFADLWGFEHVTSSPLYPQSNGEAERAVETMKMILKKCDDEYLALLNYRNTPLPNGFSPAQLSMGRKLKTRIPCHPDELKPCIPDYEVLRKKEAEYRRNMQENYNRRHGVVQGAEFAKGEKVWLPDMNSEGRVIRHHETPRSLVIQTPKSQVRRNRIMVRKAPEISSSVDKGRMHSGNMDPSHTETTVGASPRLQLSQMTPESDHPISEDTGKDEEHQGIEDLATEQQPPLRRSQRTVKKPRR